MMAHCPKVYVAIDRVDLGVVRPSETREVAFLIENKGLRRLVLNEIRCGCGSPVREAIVVPPGKSEEVPVSLEIGMESGEVERKVSFATNDTAQPRIDLTVVGHVNEPSGERQHAIYP